MGIVQGCMWEAASAVRKAVGCQHSYVRDPLQVPDDAFCHSFCRWRCHMCEKSSWNAPFPYFIPALQSNRLLRSMQRFQLPISLSYRWYRDTKIQIVEVLIRSLRFWPSVLTFRWGIRCLRLMQMHYTCQFQSLSSKSFHIIGCKVCLSPKQFISDYHHFSR